MSLVGIEDRGAVRHVVLQRAEKRNAFNGELIAALGDALRARRPWTRTCACVVVRGEGAMFSSGMDLNDLRELSRGPERPARLPPADPDAGGTCSRRCPSPPSARSTAHASGGAFELALAADFRVMAEDAVAGIMEVRVGLLPDVGGCSRLPAIVGLGNAKELIMTGKVDRRARGAPDRLRQPDRARRRARRGTEGFANELLACAPRAVGLAKRVMDAAAKPALAATLEQEVQAQEPLAASEDFARGREGVLREAPAGVRRALSSRRASHSRATPSAIARQRSTLSQSTRSGVSVGRW